METNISSSTPAIQSTSRTQNSEVKTISSRRDVGSATSGFAPRTNVNIGNSVNTMAGILAKVANSSAEAADVMPKQLQQIINEVMQSAFSVEASLGEGVGSALESSRFSTEQLAILTRMLDQLAGASANGERGLLSNELGALLKNAKALMDKMDLPNGTILNKLAFQLMNNKDFEDLPKELQQVLMQLGGNIQVTAQQPQGQNDSLSFLKQLVDAFFPRSMFKGAGNTSQPQSQSQGQPNTAQNQTNTNAGTANQAQAGSQPFQQSANNSQTLQQNNAPQGNTNGNQVFQQNNNDAGNRPVPQGNTQNQGMPQQNQNGALQQNNNSQQPASQNQPMPNNAQPQQGNVNQQSANNGNANNAQQQAQGSNQGTSQSGNTSMPNTNNNNTANSTNANLQSNAGNTGNTVNNNTAVKTNNTGSNGNADNQPTNNSVQQNQQETKENSLFQRIFNKQGAGTEPGSIAHMLKTKMQQKMNLQQNVFNNSTQNVTAMKDMAQLLLKQSALSMKDAQLLRGFINGNQNGLSMQDAKQLNLLLRMVQGNVPAALQQAGQQQGLEDLPRLWAFMQLCEMASLKNLKEKDLKGASKQLSNFVTSMRGSMQSQGTFQADGQKSLNFMIPLFFGNNAEVSYPAYVHIYDDNNATGADGKKHKETWLRICVLTDNIGAVEMTCCLYDGKSLSMRMLFSDDNAIKDFKECLPDIRKSLNNTPVTLTDIRVGTVDNPLGAGLVKEKKKV